MQRDGVISGKLVRSVNRLMVPVCPVDVVLEHGDAVWMRHSNSEAYPIVAVQIRASGAPNILIILLNKLIFKAP